MAGLTGTERHVNEHELHAYMQSVVEDYHAANQQIAVGRVEEYNSEHHAVKVLMLPEMSPNLTTEQTQLGGQQDAVTGWIPLISMWGGNGWGMKAAPVKQRAYVAVLRIGKPVGLLLAVGPFYSNTNKPPAGAEGEMVMTHRTGTRVKHRNDGGYEISQPGTGTEVVVESDGTVKIKSDKIELGDGVTDKAVLGDKLAQLLNQWIAHYNVHLHQTGGSGPPGPPFTVSVVGGISPTIMPSQDLSDVVKLK